MELPEELFRELVAGAPVDRTSPGAHHRESPRAVLGVDVTLLRLALGKQAAPEPARLVDLSARGAGLESREPIKVGEPFALRLKRRDLSPLWIQCVGVRWSVLGSERCAVGARFTRVLKPSSSPDGKPPAMA